MKIVIKTKTVIDAIAKINKACNKPDELRVDFEDGFCTITGTKLGKTLSAIVGDIQYPDPIDTKFVVLSSPLFLSAIKGREELQIVVSPSTLKMSSGNYKNEISLISSTADFKIKKPLSSIKLNGDLVAFIVDNYSRLSIKNQLATTFDMDLPFTIEVVSNKLRASIRDNYHVAHLETDFVSPDFEITIPSSVFDTIKHIFDSDFFWSIEDSLLHVSDSVYSLRMAFSSSSSFKFEAVKGMIDKIHARKQEQVVISKGEIKTIINNLKVLKDSNTSIKMKFDTDKIDISVESKVMKASDTVYVKQGNIVKTIVINPSLLADCLDCCIGDLVSISVFDKFIHITDESDSSDYITLLS